MRTEVFIDSLECARVLRRYIRLRLSQVLCQYQDTVSFFSVKVRNFKTQKGAVDKECTVLVETPVGTIMSRATDGEAGKAFCRALSKLAPSIRRRIERGKSVDCGVKRHLSQGQAVG